MSAAVRHCHTTQPITIVIYFDTNVFALTCQYLDPPLSFVEPQLLFDLNVDANLWQSQEKSRFFSLFYDMHALIIESIILQLFLQNFEGHFLKFVKIP